VWRSLPLHPNKRTISELVGTSQRCHGAPSHPPVCRSPIDPLRAHAEMLTERSRPRVRADIEVGSCRRPAHHRDRHQHYTALAASQCPTSRDFVAWRFVADCLVIAGVQKTSTTGDICGCRLPLWAAKDRPRQDTGPFRLELERQVRIDLVAGNGDGQRDQTRAAPCEKLVRQKLVRHLPGENRPLTIPIWHRSNIFPHL
jgi:hypothetical protein